METQNNKTYRLLVAQSFEGKSGAFVYVSAQTNNESATISSKIYYNGSVIEQATSTGDYVIATASGSLP